MKEDSAAVETEELSYREALLELNQILQAIEEDRFDLDELGEQVGRAAELIRLCREKIDATELKIQAVIHDLDEGDD